MYYIQLIYISQHIKKNNHYAIELYYEHMSQ